MSAESSQPPTDLWLEQSRLHGVLLGALSWNEFPLLPNKSTTPYLEIQPVTNPGPRDLLHTHRTGPQSATTMQQQWPNHSQPLYCSHICAWRHRLCGEREIHTDDMG
jgi:hypothetical protein